MPEPVNPVVQAFRQQQQSAQINASTSFDYDPEKAARAYQLEQQTGVPSSFIFNDGDVEEFENRQKRDAVVDLIKANPRIEQFVNSHPMAGKMARDDYGNLDQFSEKYDNYHKTTSAPGAFVRNAAKGVLPMVGSLPAIGGGASIGSGMGFAVGGPIGAAAGGIIGGAVGGLGGSYALSLAQDWFLSQLPDSILQSIGFDKEQARMDLAEHGTASFLGSLAPFLLAMRPGAIPTRELGADASALERVLNKPIAQRLLSGTAMGGFEAGTEAYKGEFDLSHVAMAGAFGAIAAKSTAFGEKALAAGTVTAQRVLPFLRSGKEPPYGLDPVVDGLYKEQAKEQAKRLDELFDAAQKIELREKNPDFIRTHFMKLFPEASIEIDARAAEALYGEGKRPEKGDNLLGWVPDIEQQWDMAIASGGRITVPLDHWLAYADKKKVADPLHDFIATRPGRPTLEEAKAPVGEDREITPTGDSAVDALRKQAGLEPLFGKPDDWTQATAFDFPQGKLAYPPEANLNPVFDQSTSLTKIASYTVRQALDHMGERGLRGIPDALHRFFAERLKETVGDTQINVISRADMDKYWEGKRDGTVGFYSPDKHTITMAEDVVTGMYGKDYADRWLMHEMGHAFTVRVVATDSRVARDIAAIMRETKEALLTLSPKDVARFDYAFQKPTEFIAEVWGNKGLQETLAQIPMSPKLAEALGLAKSKGSIWDAIRNIIADSMQRLWGIRPTDSLLDGMMKIGSRIQEQLESDPTLLETGERFLGTRTWNNLAGKQLELPEAGTTRMEDMPPFKSFVGMTQKQVAKYIDAAKAVWQELKEKNLERVEKQKLREGGKEWLANEAYFRKEITKRVQQRPDIAAHLLLQNGQLGDIKLPKPPRINAKSLTDEQAAALPPGWVVKRGGIPVDDIAGMFGYTSGDAMVEKLTALKKGLEEGKMRLQTYVDQVVDKETKEHMAATYGDMEQNAITDAKDQILSDHHENFMHEQVQAVAEKGGLQFPITKDQLKSAVVEDMKNTKMGLMKSDAYLADAGRSGKAMELAAQKEDWPEAFRQSQAQQLSLLRAREAAKYEKLQDQFDKRMKKQSRREIPSQDPAFTNYMHLMMFRLGEFVNRSIPDLEKEIAAGVHKNFNDFVHYWESDSQLRDLKIPEWMLTQGPVKPVKELTAAEFTQVNNAFKAMDHNARDLMSVWKSGEKADKEETIREMVEKIASLGPPKKYRIDKDESKIMQTIKSYWWSGINVETMLNRVDRNDPHGIMFRTIVSDYTRAIDSREAMMKEYQEKLSKITDIPDIDRKVSNNLFVDSNTGEFFQMRKRNVLGILQNWGNESNRQKLADGYGLKMADIENWLLANTTKEDWTRAQKIGNLFKELFEHADNMSREISGVGIEGLDLKPFENPHGKFEGWYNPVKYDSVRPGSSKALLGPEATTESQYFRATTPQGYTKERTGYIAPMELDLDIIPIRMRQMIHDINIRPTIHQLSKFFYDSKFKKAMITYYGKHQAEMFIPFLNDLANSANFKSMAQYMGTTALEYFRQNTIATLIGFNPSTVMKHGPTAALNSIIDDPMGWTREFMSLVSKDDKTGIRNWNLAFEKSELIQRRMRTHFKQFITGRDSELHLSQTSLRDFLIGVGATPVSISDLITAVPTFNNAYKKALARGEDEGFAIELGNRAVRRTHGDSILTNRPEIMRSNALGAWFSSLYGFFSHMQQRQYEMAWKAKDILRDTFGKGSGDAENATRHAPDLLKGFMSYVIFPAMVEELVTPYLGSEKDSWGKKAAKGMALGLSSSFIGVRDFVHAMVNFRDPSAGLAGTSMKALSDVGHDLSRGKAVLNREHAGNLIKHTAALTGVLTGLTNAQEGRAAEFLYRYSQGLEKPKGPWGSLVGLRYGTLDKHSRTFDEWLKHMTH